MKKKLIEVALPLEAINMESAREKSIRHGHPSTLHLWWARRPLAACRAVLWASLVDDPSSWPEKFPTVAEQEAERQRLFDILGRIETETDKKGNTKQVVRGLVSWDQINDPKSGVLEQAQAEIARCLAWERGEEPPKSPAAVRDYIAKYAPPAYDPFAGGGSIPLEAQRLGLEAHASDLNPVAVLINKALIEIPPKFKDQYPVNPEARSEYLGLRGERSDANALSTTDCVAEGNGSGSRTLSSSSEVAQGGNLRDAIADHASGGVSAGQHCRGVDKGIGQGESAFSGDRPGFLGGNGNPIDPLRKPGMVSDGTHSNAQGVDGGGKPNPNNDAPTNAARSVSGEPKVTQFSLLNSHSYSGAQGLAADVRYYGAWMRDRAFEQIGFLYPKVRVNHGGTEGAEATVIAWLWARTVKCPNPACGCSMPLVRSFQLSTKKGKEAWVEPIVESMNHGDKEDTEGSLGDLCASVVPKIRFVVKSGEGTPPEGTIITRKGAVCPACHTPVQFEYIRAEGIQGRLSQQLMAIVVEGKNGRTYLSPNEEQEQIAHSAKPTWKPDGELPKKHRNFQTPAYGMPELGDLFTNRQLVALTTFSDLVAEAKEKAIADAVAAGLPNDDQPLSEGGTGARAYGEAIATYLGMALSKLTDASTALVRWKPSMDQAIATFGRQALPMVWDYAESNIFNGAAGDYITTLKNMLRVIQERVTDSQGQVSQHDAAARHINDITPKLISTDPPYYDNIGYADLSDFFYVWLRRSLGFVYSTVFSTLLVPKSQELVATPYRFGGSKQKAQEFFEEGLGQAFQRMYGISHANYPLTVYYAFKQSETDQKGTDDESIASTGWETMLEGLIKANFSINGTWPMRSELSNRMVASGSNALASSIVLVCRPRPADAPKTTRRQFLSELKRALPKALHDLQQGNIAPVDLAQASIGPGMAVYSQYAAVLENDGSPLRVRTALQLINQLLDEFLAEQEGEFDGDTRWALTWFEQYQFNEGPYGEAETLSKARNVSVQGLVESGILQAKAGKVNLLKRTDLPKDWNPAQDDRTPDWEAAQHLIQCLDERGELATAALLAQLGDRADRARDLAYRLYSLCDKKGWTQEAIAYNSLVIAWPELQRLARSLPDSDGQLGLEI